MAIPRETISKILAAGHPDHAQVGMPASLLRELAQAMPIERIVALPISLLRELAQPAPGMVP